MRIFWVVIWLVVVGAAGVRAASEADWDVCLGEDHAKSIPACTRVANSKTETADNRAIAFYNRGASYASMGDHDRAITDYNQAFKLNPKDPDYIANRGFSNASLGNHDKAIADYNQAIKQNPIDGEYHADRGYSYLAKGQLDSALTDFDRAIELKSESSHAASYFGRGLVRGRKGHLAQARTDQDQGEAARKNTPKHLVKLTWQEQSRKALADFLARADAMSIPVPSPTIAARPSQSIAAAPAAQPSLPPIVPSRRVALVLGNSGYSSVAALPNPGRDAALIAGALSGNGFQSVSVANNLTRENLINALKAFAAEAEKADWALVYYAGHGIEVGGVNYLIPIDAKLATDRDVQFEAVPLDHILGSVEGAKRLRMVLLDACRDNPFAARMRRITSSRSIGRGLASIEPEAGTLVVYAAKHGQTAADGDGANSPFASAVVKRLTTPGLEIRKLFDLVRDDVMETTSRRQQPYTYGSVPGNEDFYFVAKR